VGRCIEMKEVTKQTSKWSGSFGQDYTDRNPQTLQEMEDLYRKNYGFSRSELNQRFLGGMDHAMRILEVGSNIANQLLCLQKMGFTSLYGIELQSYAVELAKSRTKGINLIQGDASDIPFRDGFFDMVFTSGVLIHISPSNLPFVLNEIHRCTRKYIFGFEYFSDVPQEIPYRGNRDLLWKADFAGRYLELFDDVKLLREEHIRYLQNDNVDTMFLLHKK
jgi:pseudaminic acid biosynthesis-associated methylase